MKISLVVCTKDRAEQLKQCLTSISNIRFPSAWELIVVNNASTDHTDAVLENFSARTHLAFQKVYEPALGSGCAKNTGWNLAAGEFIAFIDDDCYPHEDFLSEIVRCLERSSCGFVGGRVLLFDPTDYPITIQTSLARREYDAYGFIGAGEIHGANFAFRKQALQDVEGFDPWFGAGTLYPCEDVDILARILAAGWSGLYDPGPVVYHHHRRKMDAVPRLIKQYDRGRGAYYAKCMLNKTLRRQYRSEWFKRVRSQSIVTTGRELEAMLRYLSALSKKKIIDKMKITKSSISSL